MVACLPEEDKETVEEVRSFNEGRFIGDGDEAGMVMRCVIGVS